MTKMFPDSGVPAPEAINSLPDPNTQDCDELWYSTSRCSPRFDPAAANAMLAEMLNLINAGEVVYDCKYLDQVQLATRYIVQRGLPHAGIASGGPANYVITLDPPLTRYNDYLLLLVVPNSTNTGPVKLDVNGKGLMPLVRHYDGDALENGDFKGGVPYLVGYWSGKFWLMSLAKSQVALAMTGDVDFWIRTDGNDTTGDGTENTADKAFRTINGAWESVGKRYVPSMIYTINLRFGIPGRYETGAIGPYGGRVALWGDKGNADAYIVFQSDQTGGPALYAINADLTVIGVKVENSGTGQQPWGVGCYSSNILLWDVVIEMTANAFDGGFCFSTTNAMLGYQGSLELRGNGCTIGSAVSAGASSIFTAVAFLGGDYLTITNTYVLTSFFYPGSNSMVAIGGLLSHSGCTGYQYVIGPFGILEGYGNSIPGDIPGYIVDYGVYHP